MPAVFLEQAQANLPKNRIEILPYDKAQLNGDAQEDAAKHVVESHSGGAMLPR